MELLKAFLFGIIEGITEWLPVSSTGHMILLNEFVRLDVSEEFYSMFEVVIQLGAILAVVVLFWKKIFPFGFGAEEKGGEISRVLLVKPNIFALWGKILISCIPAAIVGILFNDFFEAHFYNYLCVSLALIIFGVAFIVVETMNKKKKPIIKNLDQITIMTALFIGMFQLIAAIFPGTSRSGATILGALLLGVSRTVAAEFTFYLAIPVMFGASLLKIIKFGFNFSQIEAFILLIGMVTAFVVSMLTIRLLMGFVKRHNFKVFGYYRIVLGFLVLGYYIFFSG